MKKRVIILVLVLALFSALAVSCGRELTEAELLARNIKYANDCVGGSVTKLYKLIGEPTEKTYSPSCLGDGEDGVLRYDGFTVYTYKSLYDEEIRYIEETPKQEALS